MSIYPCPCDKCKTKRSCDTSGHRYTQWDRWLTWFRWWWKQFNLYAKKYGIEPTTKEVAEDGNE